LDKEVKLVGVVTEVKWQNPHTHIGIRVDKDKDIDPATVGQWVCEHRDPSIRSMVRFRRAVTGTNVNHWWDNGANAIAFTRGDKGFVAINGETSAVAALVATGLPPGIYCDLITGGVSGSSCAGTIIEVDSAGVVQVSLAARTAIAITTLAKL